MSKAGPWSLKLIFEDKHRLWFDLIRGDTDRFFVETDEMPRIDSDVVVEIRLGGQPVPMVIGGKVVGLRHKSDRFPGGVYVHFGPREIGKVRKFVGLVQLDSTLLTCRHEERADCSVPVHLVMPQGEHVAITKNLSESGMSIGNAPELFESQRVDLRMTLGGVEFSIGSDVTWYRKDDRTAGLHFFSLTPDVARQLDGQVQQLLQKQNEAQAAKPPTIVVADDDPSILAFLEKALTKHGYVVCAAKRGDDALELLRQVKPRMILLDVLMPGIDGADLCKIFRADPSLAGLPVIFISALDKERLHRVAAEAGATDYMSKPVALGDLLNLVGRYLK